MKPATHALLAILLVAGCTAPGSAQSRGNPTSDRTIRAYVTNFGGDEISVIDPEGGRLVAHVRTGAKPHGVAIAPDGSAVYVSNEGADTVSIIDPRRNQVTHTIEVGKEPNQLEVSADGRYLFVTLHGQDALAVVDVEQRKVAKVIPIGRTPHIALRSPDGSRIYATSEGDMKVAVVDARTWDVTGEVPLMAFPRVLAVSADGRRLYQTIRWLNGALVIDLENKEVVDRIALGEPKFAVQGKDAHGLAVTPNGRHLWLTTQTTNSVTVIDTSTLEVVTRITVGKDPNWVGFTLDGRRAVISNTGSNDASVIDVSSQKVVATVPVGQSPKRLAVGGVDARGETSGATSMRWTFDDVAAATLPEGWKAEGTNQQGPVATWAVKAHENAPSKPNVLVLTDTKQGARGTFNLCWSDRVKFQNGVIEVKVKAGTGRVDQGGGPIWRVQDKDNYYIARWNPLEDNFRLYSVKDGRRVQLDSAGVTADPAGWHTIRIEQNGDAIKCSLDGKALLRAQDESFPGAGGVGLWTKADAASSFDDLTVDSKAR